MKGQSDRLLLAPERQKSQIGPVTMTDGVDSAR